MKTQEHLDEQNEKLIKAINDFMEDEKIDPEEKKIAAKTMAAYVVFRTQVNIEEGIGMLDRARAIYIDQKNEIANALNNRNQN